MLSIQEVDRRKQILKGDPEKLYVFVGEEYGVKRRYLDIIKKAYDGRYVTMDTMEEDFAYFREICSDPDTESLPLPDGQAEGPGEALLRCDLPDGLGRSLADRAVQNGLELTALYETAAMLLLGKF